MVIINIYAAKEPLVPKGLTLRRIEPFDWYWNNLHTDSLSVAHGSITPPASYSNAPASRKARREARHRSRKTEGFCGTDNLRLETETHAAAKDVYLGQDMGLWQLWRKAGISRRTQRRKTRERVGREKHTRSRRANARASSVFCNSYVEAKEYMYIDVQPLTFCALLYGSELGGAWQNGILR